MSEKIKFIHKAPEGEGGNGKVRKFFDLASFYYPEDRTIVVHEGEYELTFALTGEALKMTGAARHARAGNGGRVPDDIMDAARKRAYVVLGIISKEKKKDLIRGAEREAWKEADRTGVHPEKLNGQ